jgi:hypothetical protein
VLHTTSGRGIALLRRPIPKNKEECMGNETRPLCYGSGYCNDGGCEGCDLNSECDVLHDWVGHTTHAEAVEKMIFLNEEKLGLEKTIAEERCEYMKYWEALNNVEELAQALNACEQTLERERLEVKRIKTLNHTATEILARWSKEHRSEVASLEHRITLWRCWALGSFIGFMGVIALLVSR